MIDPDEIDRAQIRAARALLNWNQPELASAAHIALATLKRFEIGSRTPIHAIRSAIIRALENEGIEFFHDGTRAGVSLRTSKIKAGKKKTGK